uniref:Ig-like domain-containing protein n=1 Tax=Pyxicephalus adspersus TaxID=30357 RepID=A0AAV2ZEY0_PYXAD|nr:TPA: hypothetical protein GDO54_004077 [Pyxicephalus adspersus]
MPYTGESVQLKCVHDDTAYPTKFWYRQVGPGSPIVLIGYNYREQLTMEKDFNETKFTIQRVTDTESALGVSGVSVQDNAVYFCASSKHSETTREQRCTKLGAPRDAVLDIPQGFLTPHHFLTPGVYLILWVEC